MSILDPWGDFGMNWGLVGDIIGVICKQAGKQRKVAYEQ